MLASKRPHSGILCTPKRKPRFGPASRYVFWGERKGCQATAAQDISLGTREIRYTMNLCNLTDLVQKKADLARNPQTAIVYVASKGDRILLMSSQSPLPQAQGAFYDPCHGSLSCAASNCLFWGRLSHQLWSNRNLVLNSGTSSSSRDGRLYVVANASWCQSPSRTPGKDIYDLCCGTAGDA